MKPKLWAQQGDVLCFLEPIPLGSGAYEKINSPIVQFGEATGHAHRLDGDDWEMFRDKKTGERHLRIVRPTMLRHEEHLPIELPPGEYRIGIVREYDHLEEEARQVVD